MSSFLCHMPAKAAKVSGLFFETRPFTVEERWMEEKTFISDIQKIVLQQNIALNRHKPNLESDSVPVSEKQN